MQRGKTGKSTAKENLSGYLNPQECGNRTGVRTLSVHDDMQHGLTFQKASAPFEMSVLPYSAYELENAMHLDELPENLRGDKKVILQLIEKRRRKIEQQLLLHHPEIVEHLKKSRERLEKRLEKQNPEAARKLHEWEVQIREKEEE